MTTISLVVSLDEPSSPMESVVRAAVEALQGLDGEVVMIAPPSAEPSAGPGALDSVTLVHGGVRTRGGQLNDAIRASDGDVLVLVDTATEIDSALVHSLLSPLSAPHVEAVIAGSQADPGHKLLSRGHSGHSCLSDRRAILNVRALAVRRAAAIAVGGFDERIPTRSDFGAVEADLLLRLTEAGNRVAPAATRWSDDQRRSDPRSPGTTKGWGAVVGAHLRRTGWRGAPLVLSWCLRGSRESLSGKGWRPRRLASTSWGLARGLSMRTYGFVDQVLDSTDSRDPSSPRPAHRTHAGE